MVELQKQIIRDSINSAICIDDSYVSPYTEIEKGKDYVSPQNMYNSFRTEGECNLDIYTYRGIEDFEKNKSWLLNHRDLIVLDWELEENGQVKYMDTLRIIDDVLCNKLVKIIVIYTQNQDTKNIIYNLVMAFKGFVNDDNTQKQYEEAKKMVLREFV